MTHRDSLIAAAQAEDTQDLLQHIAWTDVIKPRLQSQVQAFSQILVNEAIGMTSLPVGKTREQIAGIAYGIQYVSNLMEKILKDGERALISLQSEGISLTTT